MQADQVKLTAQKNLIHQAHVSKDDYKGPTKALLTESMAMRLTELELAIQSLKESFKLKELENHTKEPHKLQDDKLRLTIKYNVDMIRLQKQLSNERTALLVINEKFSVLKQAYEAQLEEGQRSLQENQGTLLEKMGQLSKQLKQEKQKVLILEGGLKTANISLRSLAQFQERVLDIEGEKNLLKKSFYSLVLGTLSDHSHHNGHESKKESASQEIESRCAKIVVLEKKLNDEISERKNLEQVKKTILQEYEMCQIERAQEKAMINTIKEKHDLLEQEVLQYRQNVKSLQEKLKRDFHLDVEGLSEILMLVKDFRLQQEGFNSLIFAGSKENFDELSQELAGQQASHAETILELQKTRELLIMQQRLISELQAEINIERERAKKEKEWRRREHIKNDNKLLKNMVLQIKQSRDQIRGSIDNYENYNQIIPHPYRRTDVDQKLVQMMERNGILNHLQVGGSMLEINLTGATFTPLGLRLMKQTEGVDTSGPHEVVTFCTYTFLDYEMHSTPLVLGTQPNYSFTSCFVLTDHNFSKLGGQEVFAHIEVHQALGGVHFRTQGRAKIPLMQVLQHRGEKLKGSVNITGSNGNIIGILEFWLHLFSELKTKYIHADTMTEKMLESMTGRLNSAFYWNRIQTEPQVSNLFKMQRPASLTQPQLHESKPVSGEAGAKNTPYSSKQRNSRCLSKKDKKKGVKSSRSVCLRSQIDGEEIESLESLTTNVSDVIIPQPEKPVKESYRLKIEILSLLFEPSSSVALDQSVQQVYVEYCLLGIPRQTTETPMSLKKPTKGEEIHFNFCRVIHIDYMKAATVSQYLYTKLERTDSKQGRLRFTVISEPINEEDECFEIGHAYLDLRELLLTGNDVIECQIDIVRIDDGQEVVGRLKVSLEAAQVLTRFSC